MSLKVRGVRGSNYALFLNSLTLSLIFKTFSKVQSATWIFKFLNVLILDLLAEVHLVLNIYLFKENNKSIIQEDGLDKEMSCFTSKICSKLTINTPEQRHLPVEYQELNKGDRGSKVCHRAQYKYKYTQMKKSQG